jgi:hypothetical protein
MTRIDLPASSSHREDRPSLLPELMSTTTRPMQRDDHNDCALYVPERGKQELAVQVAASEGADGKTALI